MSSFYADANTPGGGAGSAAYSGYSGYTTTASTSTAAAPSVHQQNQQDDWFSSITTTSAPGSAGVASSSSYGETAPAPAVSTDTFGYPRQQQRTNAFAAPVPAPTDGSGSNSLPYSGSMFNPNSATGPMGGSMDSGAMNGAISTSSAYDGSSSGGAVDYDNEPPLLEELGVNMNHIATKSRAVVLPFSRYADANLDRSVMEDSDLVGPLVFALALGGEMLLSGKVSFGYIYGFGMFGCLALSLVLNLLSPKEAISVWTVTSILGYALLPVNALAGFNVLLRISRLGVFGVLMASLVIVWCTIASTRLFERGCGLRDQRYLVGYPVALIYSAFVIITIF